MSIVEKEADDAHDASVEHGDLPAATGAKDHEALHAEIRSLREKLAIERDATQALLSSSSWRLTAPLRALRRVWKGPVERDTKGVIPDRFSAPPQICNLEPANSGLGNDTYRRLDVTNALEPLRSTDRNSAARAPSVKVGFVGSDELAEELAFDASITALGIGASWRSQLHPGAFDYILIETTWGVRAQGWGYGIMGHGPQREDLVALLETCRKLAIPIVVWCREDIGNYGRFAWLGAFADRIYAVDEELCAVLARDNPRTPVKVLPVAVQPAIHNPLCSYPLQGAAPAFSDKVLFDGWWDLALSQNGTLLDKLRGDGLLVCESEWEFGGVRLMDQPRFAPYVVGCVDYIAKSVLNKIVPVELFLQASLRLPWKQRLAMLRAAAAGSLVCHSVESEATSRALGASFVGNTTDVLSWMQMVRKNPLLRMRLSHIIRREILSGHCLEHRLAEIAKDLGLQIPDSEEQPGVAMVLVTMRPYLLQSCIDRFRNENYSNRELIIVLHGDHDCYAASSLVADDEPIRIVSVGRERGLGACLNQAISESECPYWAKVDDDDLYGENYLTDVMQSRRMLDFDVAGKPPMFAYLQREEALYWDPVWADHAHLLHSHAIAENALVAGGTIVGRREVIDEVPFSETRRGGSDSDFIRRCYENGRSVTALDGFNFVRYRSGDPGFHTWAMDEQELRKRAERIGGPNDVKNLAFV